MLWYGVEGTTSAPPVGPAYFAVVTLASEGLPLGRTEARDAGAVVDRGAGHPTRVIRVGATTTSTDISRTPKVLVGAWWAS